MFEINSVSPIGKKTHTHIYIYHLLVSRMYIVVMNLYSLCITLILVCVCVCVCVCVRACVHVCAQLAKYCIFWY